MRVVKSFLPSAHRQTAEKPLGFVHSSHRHIQDAPCETCRRLGLLHKTHQAQRRGISTVPQARGITPANCFNRRL